MEPGDFPEHRTFGGPMCPRLSRRRKMHFPLVNSNYFSALVVIWNVLEKDFFGEMVSHPEIAPTISTIMKFAPIKTRLRKLQLIKIDGNNRWYSFTAKRYGYGHLMLTFSFKGNTPTTPEKRLPNLIFSTPL